MTGNMGENGKITWSNEKRRLGELHPWPINPRQINKTEAKRLADSLDRYDQVETIAIEPDNEVVNGHQRLNVWMAEHGADYQVDVRVASRKLTDDEKKRLTVYLHQGAVGEWDWDLLANNFDVPDLLEWGFDIDELGFESAFDPKLTPHFNTSKVNDDDISKTDEELKNKYGNKIELIELLCPHCAKSFSVRKDGLY